MGVRMLNSIVVPCCLRGGAVAAVLVGDHQHHLVEAVRNAVAVFRADLLRRQVGGDGREQLLVVAVLQQLHDGRNHRAEVLLLHWLLAHVLDDDALMLLQRQVALRVPRRVQPCNLAGVLHAQARGLAELAALVQGVGRRAQGMHQRRLAVAVAAAQHHPEPRRVARQEVGQQGDVARRALVVDKRAAPEGHLGHVGCLEQVEGLLPRARKLKTVPRSLLRK